MSKDGDVDTAERWTSTGPGVATLELIGTVTVSVYAPAGNVIDS